MAIMPETQNQIIMKALKIIQELCRMGNTELCGIYYHDDYGTLETAFGPFVGIQFSGIENAKGLERDQAYLYDYGHDISGTPDFEIIVDITDIPVESIRLYKIEL